MIGAVIVTHGRLSGALLDAARSIVGEVRDALSVEVSPDASSEEVRSAITGALSVLNGCDGVLIFTDMFGGTPTNIALTLHEEGKVEVITGVNLPLLLKFLGSRNSLDIKKLSEMLVDYGHRSIANAGHFLKKGRTA